MIYPGGGDTSAFQRVKDMKIHPGRFVYCTAACLLALWLAPVALAGVVLDGTRVIYPSDSRDVTVKVTNKGKRPVLVQSWLDKGEENISPDKIVTPFMLTPPINRIEPEKAQSLRISATRVTSLPQDRESVFWLNVLEIPARPDKARSGENYLQLAVRTRVKLFYRPAALKSGAGQAPKSLEWTADSKGLTVSNPTPWHVSLTGVVINGRETVADMVAPKGHYTFSTLRVARGSSIRAAWIDDYGARREQNFTVN